MPAPFVFRVGERRHTQELAERRTGGSGQALVLRERQEHDIARVVMNELWPIHERPANDVTEGALRLVERPAKRAGGDHICPLDERDTKATRTPCRRNWMVRDGGFPSSGDRA